MAKIIGMAVVGNDLVKIFPILKAIFRLRATASRIDAADALMRPAFVKADLEGQYGQMLGALRYQPT